MPHLPLYHVRQLLFDGPVWVDLNGVIVVKERAELQQPMRREVTSATPRAPREDQNHLRMVLPLKVFFKSSHGIHNV